eukprot:IDg12025t1
MSEAYVFLRRVENLLDTRHSAAFRAGVADVDCQNTRVAALKRISNT